MFSSLPIYLDPPNWNQPNQQPSASSNDLSSHLISPPPPPLIANPPPSGPNGTNSGGPPRPGSMSERARLAKIPQPEPALKCPRCDSTNTKFCYFNNYSLSQPRHFCKTCRRYWTRGGALRNVPVGGGCRRNKRSSKSSSNKSSSASASSSSTACSTATATTSGSSMIPSNFHLPFLSSALNGNSDQYGASTLGLSFMAMQQPQQLADAGDYGGLGLGLEQWRIQQFPFLGGFDSSSSSSAAAAAAVVPVHGIYPNFDCEGEGFGLTKTPSTSGIITQLASVKMEDNQPHHHYSQPHHHPHQGLNFSRQYVGMGGSDNQYLGGGWAGDLSGFNSSSSGNIL